MTGLTFLSSLPLYWHQTHNWPIDYLWSHPLIKIFIESFGLLDLKFGVDNMCPSEALFGAYKFCTCCILCRWTSKLRHMWFVKFQCCSSSLKGSCIFRSKRRSKRTRAAAQTSWSTTWKQSSFTRSRSIFLQSEPLNCQLDIQRCISIPTGIAWYNMDQFEYAWILKATVSVAFLHKICGGSIMPF